MFDPADPKHSVRVKSYRSPVPEAEEAASKANVDKLDAESMLHLHGELLSLYGQELDRQSRNRLDQASDQDFYDGIQWREDDAATLRDRGQVPLVFNVISASVDWVTGTERRSRVDFNILPRRKESAKPAERKTQLLKYLSDVNREPFHISRAFEDAVITGLGWMEDGMQGEGEDEPLYTRYESWRNMLWDSAATELDLSDARYVIRTKWVDLDVGVAMFPNRRDVLERAIDNADGFYNFNAYGDEAMDSQELANEEQGLLRQENVGFCRRRVRLIECWLRMPVRSAKMAGGQFAGELFDPHSPGHQEEIERGTARKRDSMVMQVHVAIFTTVGMLWFSKSPYRHNRFPFTPIWGHRRGKDGMPYGMVRRLRDIQEDINKRASKALHILSSNKVIMEQGALPEGVTVDEFATEVSRPDAVIEVKPGKRLEINADRDLSQWHFEAMARNIQFVQTAAGVTDENLGRRTNAQSGKAIIARQEQGSLTTAKYFDNLLLAHQVHGEKLLANIEQFMTEEKAFRITNMRGKPEFVEVNDGLPENDITRSKADFVISEGSWQASVRQAAAAELTETLSRFPPEVGIAILDLVVENMDLPNREEIVKRIRAVSGQKDPDATEPTPEDMQREQAMQARQQMASAMEEATLRKTMADAKKTEAQADQLASQIVGSNVSALASALTAATTAISLPEAAEVADHILAESGFVSQSDKAGPNAAPGLGAALPAPPQQQLSQPGLAPV